MMIKDELYYPVNTKGTDTAYPMSKPGYYAVRKGKETGIFLTWAECQAQVKGFPKAEYKKFKTRIEAEQYIGTDRSEHSSSVPALSSPVASSVSTGRGKKGGYYDMANSKHLPKLKPSWMQNNIYPQPKSITILLLEVIMIQHQ